MIGLSLSLTRAGVAMWSPRALFAAGEQGAWYDRSDLATQFQDNVGKTPVTAAGQAVGLALDKRLGLVRGIEQFAGSNIVAQAAWTANGDGSYTRSVAGFSVLGANNLTIGSTYLVTVIITGSNGSALNIYRRNAANTASEAVVSGFIGNGTFSGVVKVVSDASADIWVDSSGFTGTVRLSIKELPGNHASQATSTLRPLYQAGPAQVVYDGVDDKLTTTFPSSLGSACTVARAIPGTGPEILTAQTVGTTFDDSVTNSCLIIISRALTQAETDRLTSYLYQKAGVAQSQALMAQSGQPLLTQQSQPIQTESASA